MKCDKFKTWEIALALSVCVTLCHGAAVHWWGVIFPGLAPADTPAQVETAKLDAPAPEIGGVVLRSQLLDWIHDLGK